MNISDTAALLAYIALGDNRSVTKETAAFWFETLRDDITLDEARRAVTSHFANSTHYLAPAHINTIVAKARETRSLDLPSVIPPRDLADNPRAEIEWTHIWEDALLAGHTEDRARQIANFQMQVTEDEPLAIGAAAGIKAQMEAAALELVRTQSLKEADAREKAEAKRARYASIRAAELEAKEAQTDEETA